MSVLNNTDEQIKPVPVMELYLFGENTLEKHHITSTSQISQYITQPYKLWLNVCGLDNAPILQDIAKIFSIHPLTLEDIQNTNQRPKLEEFDEFVFITAKMIFTKSGLEEIITEHISLLFGHHFIISFQEKPDDIFDAIRVRLENPSGKMRKLGTDYFTYTLLDMVVDQYYKLIELIGERNEVLEDGIIGDNKNIKLADIYLHRKALQDIRKSTWPLREILSAWKKSDHPFIKKKTSVFINDIYEHTVEILESLELQRETITSLVEIYMTHLSIKQNEVMKTLTIIATIFIPLTFIAGIYGMNFKVMPELEWKYSYPLIWIIFITTTIAMLYYFKKKRWF
ncbi:magnesium/cobalt transporter CorA [Anditalea andensis]|uniref:Magnesium transport protein CorA n=1 Tax=Anditalea andensis TaxID=1048983 RepID=A0A074L052_9BACT|nr:magnesium/cobalt transporter CorA [Anditalea andensis]KEO74554.1 magnesium transporter [Anditalea andensis]